jgi:hypothetical protein
MKFDFDRAKREWDLNSRSAASVFPDRVLSVPVEDSSQD